VCFRRRLVHPCGYAFWQTLGPFGCVFALQLLRNDLSFSPKSYGYALGCGLFGIAIPNLIIYFSVKYINTGILTTLANSSPLFTYIFALAFRQERFTLKRMLFVMLGMIGVLLLVSQKESLLGIKFNNVSFSNIWLYGAILVPLCYAFSAVYIARFRPTKGGNVLNYAWQMLLVSSMVIVPLTLTQHDFYPLKLGDINSYLIILEIVLSSIGYVLLFVLIKRVGPVYYTLVNAIAAVTGVIYAVVLFKQHLLCLSYLAIALIVLAILGLSFTQQNNRYSKIHS
jgi:drug/metabolite transporter (DMT)-like permease